MDETPEEARSRREADADRLWQDAADNPPLIWLGTAHLPAEVVGQEVSAWVGVTTDADNPRLGTLSLALRLGGRDNPALSSEEAEYVARCLETAAVELRSHRMGRGRDE